MKFVELSYGAVARRIVDSIVSALDRQENVLWLMSGGSNVRLQVDAMRRLRRRAGNSLERLTILPVDERYGRSGHADSNYQAMKQAGFDPGVAAWPNVLKKNTDFDTTIFMYNELVANALQSDVIIATLGIGTDGHTAGILPNSSAVHATDLVFGYAANYQRMTLTISALGRVTKAFVVAFGDSKRRIVERLRLASDSVDEMPAMALYDLADCTVITIGNKQK